MEYSKVQQGINDVVGDNVKKLAQMFPSAVKDGEVDFEALKEELGQFTEVDSEKYELTWAGKKNAKKIAQEDIVGKTLKFIPEDSKNADTTENLYIEGDNLEVLKLLRQNYYGAIKMIYIDPPYNTGNDFIYNDSFEMSKEESDIAEGNTDITGERYTINAKSQNKYHATWLNMMYSRLRIAKDLLTDDGAIFISIGQDEISNLVELCNEIFGEDNRVAIVSRVMKTGGNKGQYFSPNIEYILIYSKSINCLGYFREALSDELITKVYNIKEIEGPRKGEMYRIMGLCQPGLAARPNQRYWIKCPDGTYAIPAGNTYPETIKNGEKVMPQDGDNCWKWIYERFSEELKKNNIVFKKTTTSSLINEKGERSSWNIYNKIWLNDRMAEGRVPVDLITQYENRHSSQELKDLDIPFDFAKPSALIKYLIKLMDDDKCMTILDFFSGSASTAQAVIELNAEDEGNRKYIMVQWPELCDEKTDAYKKGYTNICEIGKERIRRVIKKVENDAIKIDMGFKTFRIANTNIKWNALITAGQLDTTQVETTPDLVDFMPGADDVDIVYELMLRQRDVALSETLEQLSDIGNRTYLYASSYLVCLETEITVELINKLAELDPLPIKFIFRDSAFKDDIALKDETFRRLKALIEKNAGTDKPTYTVEFI